MGDLITTGLLLALIAGTVWPVEQLNKQRASRFRSLDRPGERAAGRGRLRSDSLTARDARGSLT
jgi:hypothetical protein